MRMLQGRRCIESVDLVLLPHSHHIDLSIDEPENASHNICYVYSLSECYNALVLSLAFKQTFRYSIL